MKDLCSKLQINMDEMKKVFQSNSSNVKNA